MKYRYLLLFVLCLSGLSLLGQEQDTEGKPPELTETQRLHVQNLTQRLEIYQLRAQLAQRDFDHTRDEFTRLLQSLEIKGYTLNVETLIYTKTPSKDK